MRLTRLPIEALSLLYLILYVPYMLVTRALATTPNAELGRPLTGLETLPAVLILGTVLTVVFVWVSGWWRSANRVSVGGLRIPFPRKWTAISGVGTSLLLFTVPLSLTFEGVSIPFMQLLMRGDVLIIAPLVDVIAGRRVRWYSWVAMALVALALTLGVWGRGGFHLPPLAILAVVLYTLGYFMRLAAMTRVSKDGDENSVRGYYVEEKIVGMPLSIVAIALVTVSPLGAQGAQVSWGFVNVWSSNALPFLVLISVAFVGISVFAALILLDPRENTFCVPFERAASILAGTVTAFVLAVFYGQAFPTPVELIATVLLIGAIALLSLAPRWRTPQLSTVGRAAAVLLMVCALAHSEVALSRPATEGSPLPSRPAIEGSLPAAPVEGHVAAEQKSAVAAPLPPPADVSYDETRWWQPNDTRTFPPSATFTNAHGSLTTISVGGGASSDTRTNPFFIASGRNGRACVTCHQPSDGMSLSVETIRERWRATDGKDPLFAAVDGSNCPHLPQAEKSSHSLLLKRGTFRIFRPWPPRAADGSKIEPEFTLEVVRDPTGCNTHPQYGLKAREPMISVYRRPRPVANVKYLTAVGFPFEPKNGLPLPLDAETGQPLSGNLMADRRNGTLKLQATEALVTHLQADTKPSEAQIQAIVAFESTLYSAQSHDKWGAALTAAGAQGGPEKLSEFSPGDLQGGAQPVWGEFRSWARLSAGSGDAGETREQREFRMSVARGAESFATKTFLIRDAAGITSMGFGNPVRNTCAFCHNMQHTGMDVAPGQVDLGTTNEPFADPAPDLPLFKLTCKEGFQPHAHLGRVVFTQDPGYALTTGQCRDIGKITIQQMRGLAARAPYFSNGTAATLRGIIDFYDRRYNIGYTEQEKQDLTNLLSVL